PATRTSAVTPWYSPSTTPNSSGGQPQVEHQVEREDRAHHLRGDVGDQTGEPEIEDVATHAGPVAVGLGRRAGRNVGGGGGRFAQQRVGHPALTLYGSRSGQSPCPVPNCGAAGPRSRRPSAAHWQESCHGPRPLPTPRAEWPPVPRLPSRILGAHS